MNGLDKLAENFSKLAMAYPGGLGALLALTLVAIVQLDKHWPEIKAQLDESKQ